MTVRLTLLPRVAFDGTAVASGGTGRLLAVLASEPRGGVSTARLVDELWPAATPEHPTKALQVQVSRARSATAHELIASTPTGYRLALDESEIDATALRLRAVAARRAAAAGDDRSALEHAEAGIALWPGGPSDDGTELDSLQRLRADSAPVYRSLVRVRTLALVGTGRFEEAYEPLEALLAASPRDETLLAGLLRAEAAISSTSAALARFEDYRRELRETVGTTPGPHLQQIQQQLLASDQPAVRGGVEHEPNALLGRDSDIEAVAATVNTSRVTSIVGPGGLGKTRLAHAVSARALQRVVQFVPLAGVTDPSGVTAEVAAALGVVTSRMSARQREAPVDLLTGIVDTVQGSPALLVLDNCEHVLDGVIALVRELVARLPDLRILTTSRAPLGLSSETVYLLPQLDIDTGVELFGQRARAARADVALPDDVVRRLVLHLDGLPLALELAAARTNVLSVQQIEERLQDRFALLTKSARDAPDRHRTLQAVIDWSWQLLAPTEQRAMTALSVFADGFDLDAATFVLHNRQIAPDPLDAVDVVEHLVEQSLLQREERHARPRFRMLETVREFSGDKLRATGQYDAAVLALLGWATELGRTEAPKVLGPSPEQSLTRLRADEDNIFAAYRTAAEIGELPALAATYASLAAIWTVESRHEQVFATAPATLRRLSHFRPGAADLATTRIALVLATLTAAVIGSPAALRGVVALRRLPVATPPELIDAFSLLLMNLDLDSLRTQGASEYTESPHPAVRAVTLLALSHLQENEGNADLALATNRRLTEAVEQVDSAWLRATVMTRSAELFGTCGEYDAAMAAAERAVPLLARFGASGDLAGMHWQLAILRLHRSDLAGARRELQSGAAQGAEEMTGEGTMGLTSRAEVELATGDVEAGLRSYRQAVRFAQEQAEAFPFGDVGRTAPWLLVARGGALIAHLLHDRLASVESLPALVRQDLATMQQTQRSSPLFDVDLPICASGTLALTATLAHDPSGGAPDAQTVGRGLALADALGLSRLPVSITREHANIAALEGVRPAYDRAERTYAGLDGDQRLRALQQWLLEFDQAWRR